MELESIPLQKDDSTPTKAPLKHAPVKKNVTRRTSANKLATFAASDPMHLTGDARLSKERELSEVQKNGKLDNAQAKTIEKTVPTVANIHKEERKARSVNSSVTQQDKVRDIQQNTGEKSIKSNVARVVEYAPTRLAEVDETTTEEDIANCVGHKANANEISFVVCTWNGCNKYFTKMEKFTQHRKRDHDTTEIEKDIWIFGNVNKGGETSTNAVSSKVAEVESSMSISKTTSSPAKATTSLPINPSSPITKVDGPSTLTPTTAATIGLSSKPRRPKDQLDVPNPIDNSLPAKRSRDSTTVEKEVTSKRRETQISPQFPGGHNNNGNNNNNEMRQAQRLPRRFPIEEEQIIGPDARMRYPRGNRGQGANPMYGLPYDTGDPRYYNTMQMHPISFVYGEIPPPPPPRYDGSYGDMPYGQFYGNGNRRFLNSPPPPPPPPPPRRSR